MQRVTTDIRYAFLPVEQATSKYFIPALFQGLGKVTPGRGVTHLIMKQAGLDLPNLKYTAPEKWSESCVITGNIVAAIRGQEEFWTADNSTYFQEGRVEVRKRSNLRAEEALAETLAVRPVQGTRHLRRVTKTWAWLMVQPSTLNGTELSAQEWRYALLL